MCVCALVRVHRCVDWEVGPSSQSQVPGHHLLSFPPPLPSLNPSPPIITQKGAAVCSFLNDKARWLLRGDPDTISLKAILVSEGFPVTIRKVEVECEGSLGQQRRSWTQGSVQQCGSRLLGSLIFCKSRVPGQPFLRVMLCQQVAGFQVHSPPAVPRPSPSIAPFPPSPKESWQSCGHTASLVYASAVWVFKQMKWETWSRSWDTGMRTDQS